MVFNFINFSILSQFFVVILFNKSLFLRGIIFQLQELSGNATASHLVVDQTTTTTKKQQQLENKIKENGMISSTKLPTIFSRYGQIILYYRFVNVKLNTAKAVYTVN